MLLLFVLLVLLLLLLLVTLTVLTDVAKVLLLLVLVMMVDETDNGSVATDDGMVTAAMLDVDILGKDDTGEDDNDEVIDGGAATAADKGVALRDKLAFVVPGAVLATVDTVAVVEVVVIVGTVVLFSVTGATRTGPPD